MIKSLDKYWSIFKIQVVATAAYPGDLVARSLTILVFMWVFLQLWRTTYSMSGATQIAGLTLHDTLWYLLMAETIVLSRPRVSTTIAESVKDGSVAYLLAKPYDFVLYHMCIALGDTLPRMATNLLIGGALVWSQVGAPPNPLGWPLVLLALTGAWLIDFSCMALLGLLAFLTEEIAPFEWIYQKLVLVLGGLLFPLDFFPDWLRLIAERLPFAYALYAPARLFVSPDWPRFAMLMLGQGIWLAVLTLALTVFYRRMTAALAVNGG